MKKLPTSPAVVRFAFVIVCFLLGGLPGTEARAEERDRGVRHQQHEKRVEHRAPRHVERVERDGDHYRSPSWEFDARFRHDHYYPRRGSYVTALPPNFLDIEFRGNRFYFQGGVWFRHVGLNFEVALPPVGIVVPVLPPAYTTVWLASRPYYYANGVYYVQEASVPGYVVVEPPAGINEVTVQPAPIATPAPVVSAVPSAVVEVDEEPLFVYPRNNQTDSMMVKDRSECNGWASAQTGYRSYAAADEQQRSNYRRAVSACLEGRSYTVK